MIIRDDNGNVTAVSVRYHGVDIYISRDMLAGENKNCNQKEMAKVLQLAQLDPEIKQAIDEMVQSIMEH